MSAVKVYKYSDVGAPTSAGQIGKMITLLDAVLVNGYNQVNVSSMTRANSLVTVVTTTDHGYKNKDIVLVSGAAQSKYNDEFRITVINSTTFTFAISDEPVSPATGTITVKKAPAGFSKVFTGINKAVYRSNDLSSDRRYFRIVDDGSTNAGVSEFSITGWETMVSVDSGTGRFPNTFDDANGQYCRKSSTSDATARPWMLVTNGKTVYFFIEHTNTVVAGMTGAVTHTLGFGDSNKLRSTDSYASFISGTTTSNATNPMVGIITATNLFSTPTYSSSISFNRDLNGISLGRNARVVGIVTSSAIGSEVRIRYPNDADKSLIIGQIMMVHDETWRATLPGLYDNMHGRVLTNGDFIENVKGYEGRTFQIQYCNSNNLNGCFFIDLTGPWE